MGFSNLTSNATTKALTREDICNLPTKAEFQAQTAFLIFILILTFFGNLLVILAVIYFHRLRSITNYFIVSLAVSDLLVAVLSLPFRLDQTVHNANWCLSHAACDIWIMIDTTCSFASIWNLAIISIDRYTAIVHPFRYHSIMTTKVGYGLIGFAWCFPFTISLLMFMNWTDWDQEQFFYEPACGNRDKIFYTFAAYISFYLPLLIVLVMYGGVFRVALNQAKAMASLQVASNNRGRRSSINLVKEVKAAKTLAIVIGCFVVCWFPFTVMIQISFWDNDKLTKSISNDANMALNLTFVYALPALNSTLNPIIYALFNRDFRQAFKNLVKRITGKPLGAVGFGEASTNETNASMASKGAHNRAIRFRDHDSESSEAPPTIPMRDPNAFYNEGCKESPATGSLAVPHDTNSLETSLDDEKPRQFSPTNGNARLDTETSQSNGVVGGDVDSGENPSKRELPQKLPPLERNGSKSTDDEDVDFGRISKPKTLPPIESTTNGEINPSPSPARSEHSERSSSSPVNFAGNEQKDDDKSDRIVSVL